jgi:UDP-N-acetylglucosamine:LPS N-acetylglucosamine transferase
MLVARTPSILFAISDTGSGHRAAAVAISAAIEQQAGAEPHIVDLLASTGVPFLRDASVLYDQFSTRWLPLFDFLYQLSNGRRRINALTQAVYLQAGQNIARVLEETRPNLVVSLHPLANRLIGNTRRQHRLSFRFVTVVTDLISLHAAWADPDADLCIVPTDEAYARMRKSGIPEGKLVRTGFPVHPRYTVYTRPKLEARTALGIAIEPFTVLLTSGGIGAGNLRELVIELDRAYPQLQFLVVTGKNAVLRQGLLALGLRANVRIYGFVDNMEELMAASDVIITKAGPGTLMEALVMHLPVIVTHAVGMQEHGNIDFVLNHELGTFCPTMDRVIPAIAELTDSEIYAATAARLANAVPRDGSAQIARILLEQLQLEPPHPHQRIRLPSIADLRHIGTQQLHRKERS